MMAQLVGVYYFKPMLKHFSVLDMMLEVEDFESWWNRNSWLKSELY